MMLNLAGCDADNTAQDPRVTGFPIVYVKRPFPLFNDDGELEQPDIRQPLQFYPRSDLFLREHATVQADEKNITASITEGMGDVKDVAVSYDGKKLLFAAKKPDIDGLQPEEQPTWNIWEYNLETGGLRRIIRQDVFAEEGNDIDPQYLPDGRIIFSSTRQYGSKEVLTNEAKPRYTSLVDQEDMPAMMLHVMNADGSDIRQITFAPAMDLDPFVRQDGKVVFMRWDRFNGQDSANIYAVNPDGTGLELLYGAHSHDISPFPSRMQFSQLREFPAGGILSIMRPYTDTYGGGDIVVINSESYADYQKSTRDFTGQTGTGLVSLSGEQASPDITPKMGGRYISVYPLWDGTNRSLVSWTPCLIMQGVQSALCTEGDLTDPDVVEAEPLYNLYIYDHDTQTKLNIFLPSADFAITDVAAAQARSYPRLLEDTVEASKDRSGILHIRSVYDYDGKFNTRGASVTITDPDNPLMDFVQQTTPDERPARFIRLIKPFVRPDRMDFQIPRVAFGRSQARDGLMEIIGYAPIEPDGSVKVRVPADVPFSFQILDRNGRRIGGGREQRHMSWIQVRKGETLECNGCHIHTDGVPHGRLDAIHSINRGADSDGAFPGQDSLILAKAGETMAEARMRVSCETDSCNALKPSVNIVYDDVWSIGKLGGTFSYEYDFFDSVVDPVSQGCATVWTERCRTIINYEKHIDPIWSKVRTLTDTTPVTCNQADCHAPFNGAGEPAVPKPNILEPAVEPAPRIPPTAPRLPPAETGSQLNLESISMFDFNEDPNRLKSYRELMFDDVAQELIEGSLVDAQFDGAPIVEDPEAPIPVYLGYVQFTITTRPARPMVQGNANGSRFFNIFSAARADPIHYDPAADGGNGQAILTPGELKLISEWLDIGAQYYNDPFAVPPP
ncbi:MAG: hypothetical protein OEZ23_06130 [Gammaproteobacteria bacterium]|nr:hypothetical protein [Gammaproteobacteria bacterium]